MVSVNVEIDMVTNKRNLATELRSKLRNLIFKVQPILRAKNARLDGTLSKDARSDNVDSRRHAPIER